VHRLEPNETKVFDYVVKPGETFYNGPGDDMYERKLVYAMTALSRNKEAQCHV